MINKYTLDKANSYIENHLIDKKYYPKINYSAPIGWINDPNGVSIYNDELHLFYQYYPYESSWGPMHWGHAKSKDGINWEDLPVALAPDKVYDKDGCFSGSAIEKDGKLYLMYTGHLIGETEEETRQNQNIAISEDGINFRKYENNPVIDTSDVPEGSSVIDFRDPKVFKHAGKYYVVIGSKTINNEGQVLLYESDDLLKWEFKSVVLEPNDYLGDMVECPDLLLFEDKAVFLLSAMNYTDEETGEFYPHISWLIEGKLDWETFKFKIESLRKMDGGFDYYAPQSVRLSDNPSTYLAIAWHQAWNRTLPSHDENLGWAGQMTIPRLLEEKDGHITQSIYPKVLDGLKTKLQEEQIELMSSVEIETFDEYLEFKMKANQQVELSFSNEKEEIKLVLDAKNNRVDFDRTNTIEITDNNTKKEFNKLGYSIENNEDYLNVQILVDTSSIQVFINDYYTISSTYYVEKPLSKLSISSNDNAKLENFKTGSFNG